MNTGRLFVISGPSGVGKGTICKEILEKDTPGSPFDYWLIKTLASKELK